MIVKLCTADQVPAPGTMRAFRGSGRELCLARPAGTERLFVFDNRCPHQHAPLSAGTLEGCTVVCPYHQWRFDAATGKPEVDGDPPLEVFEVRQFGTDILVRLPEKAG